MDECFTMLYWYTIYISALRMESGDMQIYKSRQEDENLFIRKWFSSLECLWERDARLKINRSQNYVWRTVEWVGILDGVMDVIHNIIDAI